MATTAPQFFGLFTEDGLDQICASATEATRETRDLREMGCTVHRYVTTDEARLYAIDEHMRDGVPFNVARNRAEQAGEVQRNAESVASVTDNPQTRYEEEAETVAPTRGTIVAEYVATIPQPCKTPESNAPEFVNSFTHSAWADYPGHPVAEWREEVAADRTRDSYLDWINTRIDAGVAPYPGETPETE